MRNGRLTFEHTLRPWPRQSNKWRISSSSLSSSRFSFRYLIGGTDEAICYAETASSPEDRKFANQLININGEEVLNKRKVYERSRAKAWSNEDSIIKLATTIMKESAEMKSRFGIDAIKVSNYSTVTSKRLTDIRSERILAYDKLRTPLLDNLSPLNQIL